MQPKILAKGSFLPENIVVLKSPKPQRQTSPEIEKIIDQTWAELEVKAVAQGQPVWNGDSLRLDSLVQENGQLILHTSLTNYRTRMGLERNIAALQSLGMAYLSYGLAIGGFVETKNGDFIFIERSPKSLSRSRYDFVGGVMDKIAAKDGFDLLDHNFQEIQEEINVDQNEILEIKILGLILANSGSVIIVTKTVLNLSSAEVCDKFLIKHDPEAVDLKIVSKAELPEFMHTLGGYKPIALELFELDKISFNL